MREQIPCRERSVRRRLRLRGLRLEKTPARSWLREHYGVGYQVLDGNMVVFGCYSREYMASLDEIEDWLAA